MILWHRRRGLDRTIHQQWLESLAGTRLTGGQVLGWAEIEGDGVGIASRGLLSIRARAGAWRHVGWHQIERGGFDGDTGTLHWTGYDGETEQVVLTAPGSVPPVFRERIAASIAVEEYIPLDPAKESGPGVVISGRRNLGTSDTKIEWHASLPQGTSWNTAGVRELADAAISRLRAEYDPAG